MKRLLTLVVVALSIAFSSTAFAAPKEAPAARPSKLQHMKRLVRTKAVGKTVHKATSVRRGGVLRIPRRTRVVKH